MHTVVYAQNYPVQSTALLTSSFTGNLSDLTDPTREQLKLLLTLNDFREPNLDVKLQVKIDGPGFTINSKPWFYEGPFNLIPGIPTALSGIDFSSLLSENYLEFNGLDKQVYTQRGVLPEGFYTITFSVFDQFALPVKQVANTAVINTWFSLCDPPLLNQPFCGTNISVVTPQTVLFSWSPMHLANPAIDVTQLEYQFQLFELRPNAQDANIVVQTTFPIYNEYVTSSQLLYGITEPMLIEGLSYVWRVRAIDKRNRALFKNEGYSQVCTFTYGTVQQDLMEATPIVLYLDATFKRSAKLRWDSIGIYKSYVLSYRKTGNAAYNWFQDITENGHAVITQLEPKTEYEATVRGITALGDSSPYSNTLTFTTIPPNPPLICGDMNVPLINEASPLLKNAQANIIVDVGQFEMLITHIEPLGSLGHYKGLGRIETPVLGSSINVYFTDITINEDLQVTSGRVIGASDGIDQWIADNSMGSLKSGHDSAEHVVTVEITNINQIVVDKANCTITVNAANGNVGTTIQACVPTTIMDKNGNLYGVDESGNVVYIGKSGTGKGAVPANKNYIVTKYGKGIFYADLYPTYGFDSLRYEGMKVHYKEVLDSTANKKVPVAWQSVECGKMATVRARVRVTNKTVAPSKLQFITGVGTLYKASLENASSYQSEGVYEFKLNVIASGDGDVQELFIRDTVNKKYIGKLHVVSYKKVKKKVHLIPLEASGSNLSYSIDKDLIKADLNHIYKQAVTEWDVVLENKLNIDTSYWDEDANNKLAVSRGSISQYSSEMRSINRFVRGQAYYDKNDYYLLLSPLAPDSSSTDGVKGEMPRAKHIGYIFTTNTTQVELGKVIAHELAHGAFNLAHPFDEIPGISKGQTDNLLDYTTSSSSTLSNYHLHKYQWDLIHKPASIIGLLEDTEDGMLGFDTRKYIFDLLNEIKRAANRSASVINPKKTAAITNVYLNGIQYNYIKISIPPHAKNSIVPRNNIYESTDSSLQATFPTGTNLVTKKCVNVDNSIHIIVPDNRITNMKQFLSLPADRNLLLFVNGYRFGISEPPNSNNQIMQGDLMNYWDNTDIEFITRISTRNVIYADGHHSITTANHNVNNNAVESKAYFAASLLESIDANTLRASNVYCYQNPSCVHLHTTPNVTGFNYRRTQGKIAGQNLLNGLQNGSIICRKNAQGKIIDTLDIVSHSMGYAYALGMLDILKGKIHFGRFYSLAPENPCSGQINLSDFEEVWQYGTNEVTEKIWLQDGVAPQCAMQGLGAPTNTRGRIYIPEDGSVDRGFIESHTVKNYKWIFNQLSNSNYGYIKKRK